MLHSKAAVVDTGFLYALFDSDDPYYLDAASKIELVEALPLLMPWPCLYEAVNTRFVKNQKQVQKLDRLLKRPNVKFLSDMEYRDRAYEITMEWGQKGRRRISLVDMVIRLMLDNVNLHIGYLFTSDLRDFQDICRKRGIELHCVKKHRK